MSQPIDRRTFLKGLGTVVGLPLLEAMMPMTALAASSLKNKPMRMAFMFVPNGVDMANWTPATDGLDYVLPDILKPLADLRNDFNVLSGLTQNWAFAHGDGPGDHARSTAVWLTGVKPRKTAGSDISLGISVDQIAAQHLGKLTKFASLEIGCEGSMLAGDCDSGYSCAYSSNVSWRSATTPVAKEINPRLVFERLFGSSESSETAERSALRKKYRLSVLDFVMDDAQSLKGRLGTRDQAKMEEYFQGVREIEMRLARIEASEKKMVLDGVKRPDGIPSEYEEHIRLMGDMMILAFQADLTRVCTFMLANDGSNRSFKMIGVPEGHHDISHHGNDPAKKEKKRIIDKFHAEQLGYVLRKMKSIKEGDGTMLDNSLIVYGAGISDGDRHNHDDLPILLAGNGGGALRTGRHLRYQNYTPMANLFLSMLDRNGVRIDKMGDSTGQLNPLF